MILTQQHDVDILILNFLDDEELLDACIHNRYLFDLYRDNDLWIRRIAEMFRGAEKFIGTNEPKEFYITLIKISPFDQT